MSTAVATAALIQVAPEGSSALSRLFAAVPTDPASVVTLLLLVGFGAMVVWFGRPKRGKGMTKP